MISSPLTLGMAAGQSLRKMLSLQPGLVIAHSTKGRRRYTCELFKNNEELCNVVEQVVSNFPGVTSVKVNPITGSLTICYNQQSAIIDRLIDSISHCVSGKHAIHDCTIIPSQVITLSNNVNDCFRVIKNNIAAFFNHTEPLFISRIVGLALFSYGIYRIVQQGDRPAGPQLFWWGLGLLLRQGHNHSTKIPAKTESAPN